MPAHGRGGVRAGLRDPIVSFIVSFGDEGTGEPGGRAPLGAGRRKPILVVGLVVGLPVPFMIMRAPCWEWVDVANVLLGANQGLRLVDDGDHEGRPGRPAPAGFRAGSERVGRLPLVAAVGAGRRVDRLVYALRPEPFTWGRLGGLRASALGVGRPGDARARPMEAPCRRAGPRPRALPSGQVFADTSWRDRRLSAACQAGFINNLNDGMAWGLFPLFFAALRPRGRGDRRPGGRLPGRLGGRQLGTGPLSDRFGRKWLIAGGMGVQAAGISLLGGPAGLSAWLRAPCCWGSGTAMVYPTLLAAIGDVAHPVVAGLLGGGGRGGGRGCCRGAPCRTRRGLARHGCRRDSRRGHADPVVGDRRPPPDAGDRARSPVMR